MAVLFAGVILIAGISDSSTSGLARPGLLEGRESLPDVAVSQNLAPTSVPTATPAKPKSESLSTSPAVGGLPDLTGFVVGLDSQHFSFYAEPDSYALANIDDFAGQAEMTVEEMGDRVEGDLGQRVSFYLYGSARRDYGGLTFFSPPLIYLEYGGRSSRARTKALVGHELTHLITMHSLGYPNSLVHLEGTAHWASEAYWTNAVGESFDNRVRRYLARSAIVPLADLATKPSLWRGTTQLLAYDESGSFVGYLIRAYGLGQFKRVYLHSNYAEVYGKSLAEMESDWLADLDEGVESALDPLRRSLPWLGQPRAGASP